jgi:hypothetical protein
MLQKSLTIPFEKIEEFKANCQKFNVEIKDCHPYKFDYSVWMEAEVENFNLLDEACPYMYGEPYV